MDKLTLVVLDSSSYHCLLTLEWSILDKAARFAGFEQIKLNSVCRWNCWWLSGATGQLLGSSVVLLL